MHGWTDHGTPCCENAPLAERPDAVTVCGDCATCRSHALMLHNHLAQLDPDFWADQWAAQRREWELRERLRGDMRFTFMAANMPASSITLLTNGGS